MVLTAYFRALPGDRAFLSPSSAEIYFRQLDASVEASGPHDFAVRSSAVRLTAPSASTASRPALMTLRNAPSVGQDGGSCRDDLPDGRIEIFFQMGLDSQFTDLPVGQSD